MVREFSTTDDGNQGSPSRGDKKDKKVLYDDFVDMLVVGSPRCGAIPPITKGLPCFHVFFIVVILCNMSRSLTNIRRNNETKGEHT